MKLPSPSLQKPLNSLAESLTGALFFDDLHKTLYATDASIYREMPLAVAFPKDQSDLQLLIQFANRHACSLIPRTAGTSLAGQCVGSGIVVDLSKYFTKILDFDSTQGVVRVQPGLIRDELNRFLKPHGWFFSPITSTANRAMIGGMVGNNASGTNSIKYGVTRDKVIEMEVLLSDGTQIKLQSLDASQVDSKKQQNNLEGKLYQQMDQLLSDPKIRQALEDEMPKPQIHRRNTGYALDILAKQAEINFAKLICGSEGTLAIATSITLQLDPIPEPENVVLAAHFETLEESLIATQIAMNHAPHACELMDHIILECTKANREQQSNRFFIQGDPKAILLVAFHASTAEAAVSKAEDLIRDLKSAGLAYHFPIIPKEQTPSVWQLRSAGLGLLANIPGDRKAVACIEDTAVALEDLPAYIQAFNQLLQDFGQEAVHYAHAGAGELHLRPILDLKKPEGIQQLALISEASARLVKRFRGSLSGEHGDGRVRAPFLEIAVGSVLFNAFRQIKNTWDPQHIFNPGKIVDAAPITENLRYEGLDSTRTFDTILDFSATQGLVRMAEKCNGSGDCRKLTGTMCPTYQATRNEKDSTRGRANVLREFLSRNESKNPFDNQEIKSVMDLCISCKACSQECPSNVDMSRLKAEFLHQYYQSNRIPLRAKVFAQIGLIHRLGSRMPKVFNAFNRSVFGQVAKRLLGVSKHRSLPDIHTVSLRSWYLKNRKLAPQGANRIVYFFVDAFTNHQDAEIGIQAIQLLYRLGYEVKMIDHPESGRAAISKGLLPMARRFARKNVELFAPLISESTPLIGLEPSAILSFRDEFPQLVGSDFKQAAENLAPHCLMIEEFLANEVRAGRIRADQFVEDQKTIHFHAHCHQKALANPEDTLLLLSLPPQYLVSHIPSGCCGMAGSFGYEAEHLELSRQIGEMVLLPTVRASQSTDLIVANGTSCRSQIKDFTDRKAIHPVTVLLEALKIE